MNYILGAAFKILKKKSVHVCTYTYISVYSSSAGAGFACFARNSWFSSRERLWGHPPYRLGSEHILPGIKLQGVKLTTHLWYQV
jgi:hypothetical protein